MGYGEEGRQQLVFPNVEDVGMTFIIYGALLMTHAVHVVHLQHLTTVTQEAQTCVFWGEWEGELLGLKQILVLEMTDFRSVVCTLYICDVVFKCNFIFGTPKFKENLQEEV